MLYILKRCSLYVLYMVSDCIFHGHYIVEWSINSLTIRPSFLNLLKKVYLICMHRMFRIPVWKMHMIRCALIFVDVLSFIINAVSSQVWGFRVKDKTVGRQSYLWYGVPILVGRHLYWEGPPVVPMTHSLTWHVINIVEKLMHNLYCILAWERSNRHATIALSKTSYA